MSAPPSPTQALPEHLDQVLSQATPVALPLRVTFRGVQQRESVLLHGPAGWSEFGPFVEYDDDEAAWWLASALESAWWGPPGEALRTRVAVNATVPAVSPGEVAQVLSRFPGCTTVKVKVAEVGQTLAEDVSRVAEVRRLVGAHARIRVDANAGWSVPQALQAIRSLADFDLDYVEQPCPAVKDLLALREAMVRDHLNVRIAGDESIRKADDPIAVARTGVIDVAVIKVPPLGGVRRALRICQELQEQWGVDVVVSSALDSSVSVAGTGVALAARLPQEPAACGLGTAGLFAEDLSAAPLVAREGSVPVGSLSPDASLVDRAAQRLSPERQQWWLARLERCFPLALRHLAESSREGQRSG